MIAELGRVMKRLHYPVEVMLLCVRWYAASPLSLRRIEEMMSERGVSVDHATIHRWALKILPVLARVFRRCKHPVGTSWRMDETYILVAGQWKLSCEPAPVSPDEDYDFEKILAARDLRLATVLARHAGAGVWLGAAARACPRLLYRVDVVIISDSALAASRGQADVVRRTVSRHSGDLQQRGIAVYAAVGDAASDAAYATPR